MAGRSLEDQLEAIWVQHLPTTISQIERVAGALLDIERGASTQASRELAGADAHRLVGMAATYGRMHLADVARAAERLLRAPELSDEDVAEAVDVAGQLEGMTTP